MGIQCVEPVLFFTEWLKKAWETRFRDNFVLSPQTSYPNLWSTCSILHARAQHPQLSFELCRFPKCEAMKMETVMPCASTMMILLGFRDSLAASSVFYFDCCGISQQENGPENKCFLCRKRTAGGMGRGSKQGESMWVNPTLMDSSYLDVVREC